MARKIALDYTDSNLFRKYLTGQNLCGKYFKIIINMFNYLITSCQPLFESTSSVGLVHASYSLALSSSDLNIILFIDIVRQYFIYECQQSSIK